MFLPSIKEIKEVADYILKDLDKSFYVIQRNVPFHVEELHGGLRPAEKDKVFNPHHALKNTVRIILATKIAETAITLDDIYYVLDSGKETEYFFDEKSQMDYHKQMDISMSSAIQRKGRAGRIANGYCFKMYKQEEEYEFRDTSMPEILRMDISDIILAQINLSDYFKTSDLMYYSELEMEKINQVTSELKRIEALEIAKERTLLSKKGIFIVQSGLKTFIAAFLYECLRYGAREVGIIAATALQSMKGVFRKGVGLSHEGCC